MTTMAMNKMTKTSPRSTQKITKKLSLVETVTSFSAKSIIGFTVIFAACVYFLRERLILENEQRPDFIQEFNTPFVPHKTSNRFVMEDFTRFSKSHMWQLNYNFYDQVGIKTWTEGIVPNYISTNALIAHSYAQLILGFLQDGMKPDASMPLDVNEPLYIVELGTGHGHFSHLLLKALLEVKDQLPFPLRKIKLIMTDFTEANFKEWMDHPQLKQYIDQDLVDFAIFDAGRDSELTLYLSKVVLKKDVVKNPMIVIANYLFDSLVNDIFRVQDGQLKEGLISLGSSQNETDMFDYEIVKRMKNEFRYQPVQHEDYYQDGEEPVLNTILKWYKEHFNSHNKKKHGTFLFPLGSFRALHRLGEISSHRMMLLGGDKAHIYSEDYAHMKDPYFEEHGCFSVSVNFHAIGLYFAQLGGFVIQKEFMADSFDVSIFIMNKKKYESLPRTELGDEVALFEQYQARAKADFPHLVWKHQDYEIDYGTSNLIELAEYFRFSAEETLNFDVLMALLKVSDWDPEMFKWFRPEFEAGFDLGEKNHNDLIDMLPVIVDKFFKLDVAMDSYFDVAQLYFKKRDFVTALAFYTQSMNMIKNSPNVHHNMGLCHYYLGDKKKKDLLKWTKL